MSPIYSIMPVNSSSNSEASAQNDHIHSEKYRSVSTLNIFVHYISVLIGAF